MSINLNNYEVYLMDHLDGNLSVDLERELMLFLEKHPDIKSEFENFEDVKISDENLVFENKNSLKRNDILPTENINEENYEEFFVAYYEGDLSADNEKEILRFVELNPELKKEFKLHSSLILTTENIEFEYKDKLKKRRTIAVWQFQSLATAASVALLISVFWFLSNNQPIKKSVYTISHVSSKNISLENNVNTNIIEKNLEVNTYASNTLTEETVITKPSEQTHTSREDITISNLPANTNLYADIRLTGDIECAKVKYPSKNRIISGNNTVMEEDNLIAKILKKNTKKLTNNILPEQNTAYASAKKDPALVRILQGGLAFFATVTGNKVDQVKVYDQQGELKNYQIEGNTFRMNKKFGPKGAE
ncbi:MAG: hypothetical protein C0598_13400 [Marinilabiliales bacterium]|nr:MAG: hypothetical protein C0598_13400 [Marinilabiliales bacterium]